MSLQALIPPCAQTECDRFTGTIENKSTVTPSSASLMAQAKPASPPPTTITFFFDAMAMSVFRGTGASPVSLLPHFLPHLRALLMNELQMMIEMLHIIFELLPQRRRPALVVHPHPVPRAAWQRLQHLRKLPAIQVKNLHRILRRLLVIGQMLNESALVIADQRRPILRDRPLHPIA